MTSCLAILLLSVCSAQGAGPLPEFAFKGIALHPENLSYAPTQELEHPSLIKMEGRAENPLGNLPPVPSTADDAKLDPKVKDEIDDAFTLEVIRRRRNQAYARVLIIQGDELRRQERFQEALDKYHLAEKVLMAIAPPTAWHSPATEAAQ